MDFSRQIQVATWISSRSEKSRNSLACRVQTTMGVAPAVDYLIREPYVVEAICAKQQSKQKAVRLVRSAVIFLIFLISVKSLPFRNVFFSESVGLLDTAASPIHRKDKKTT